MKPLCSAASRQEAPGLAAVANEAVNCLTSDLSKEQKRPPGACMSL